MRPNLWTVQTKQDISKCDCGVKSVLFCFLLLPVHFHTESVKARADSRNKKQWLGGSQKKHIFLLGFRHEGRVSSTFTRHPINFHLHSFTSFPVGLNIFLSLQIWFYPEIEKAAISAMSITVSRACRSAFHWGKTALRFGVTASENRREICRALCDCSFPDYSPTSLCLSEICWHHTKDVLSRVKCLGRLPAIAALRLYVFI